jgi:hypothetical protein
MADETIGTGGSNTAPIGTEFAGNTSEPATEPAVIDIPDENALIRVKGSDKPVKYGEQIRGFQAAHTRAAQQAAQFQRELAAERALREKYEQERAKAQNPNQPQADPLADLRGKSYLTGEDAASVVQNLTQELQQRDQVLMAMYKEIKDLRNKTGELYGNHTNQSFESKVTKWVGDAGFDVNAPGIKDIAQEIYLAYEGNDLDQEFPRMFAERMKQMEEFFEGRRRQAIERNRRMPFVPGRGGQGGPSKPLEFAGNASAREITDQMWPLMRESGT